MLDWGGDLDNLPFPRGAANALDVLVGAGVDRGGCCLVIFVSVDVECWTGNLGILSVLRAAANAFDVWVGSTVGLGGPVEGLFDLTGLGTGVGIRCGGRTCGTGI